MACYAALAGIGPGDVAANSASIQFSQDPCRQGLQLEVAALAPVADTSVAARGDVVANHVELLGGPAGAQDLEEGQERGDAPVGGDLRAIAQIPTLTCSNEVMSRTVRPWAVIRTMIARRSRTVMRCSGLRPSSLDSGQ